MNNCSLLPYCIFFLYVGGIYKVEAKVILIAYDGFDYMQVLHILTYKELTLLIQKHDTV